MMKPSIGRVLWYWPPKLRPSQPRCAWITHVHDDRHVNLTISRPDGETYGECNVLLMQDNDIQPVDKGHYAQFPIFSMGA